MKEETLFRKVNAKERLPNSQGTYFTSIGLMHFSTTQHKFEAADLKHEWVDYWLEEIPVEDWDETYKKFVKDFESHYYPDFLKQNYHLIKK